MSLREDREMALYDDYIKGIVESTKIIYKVRCDNMIAAQIRKIYFAHDDYKQTVAFQRLGDQIANSPEIYIDAVIADNKASAVKMLRKDLQTYLSKSLNITCDPGWFAFSISTAEIKDNRFSMNIWFEEGTEYPAVGDVE